jgi:hypothetical protein
MANRLGWLSGVLMAVAVVVAGCGSDTSVVVGGDGGTGDGSMSVDGSTRTDGTAGGDDGAPLPDGTTDDASGSNPDGSSGSNPDGSSGSNPDGSSGSGADGGPLSCRAFGGTCSYGQQCCSGVCDTRSGTCASSIATCAPATAACTGNTDCCSGACVSGHCGTTQCLSIGVACPAAGNACCTGNCSGGTCKAIATNPSCVTANNTCTSSAQCCSGLCSSGGRCAIGSSYCIQTNDICYHATDCCGGICTAPNGQAVTGSNPGLCSQPSSGAVNCTGVDGSLCPGGNCGSCCSRLCAPYGPTGVNICQPAQGCRVEGDLCRHDADCCGAAGSGVLGDGAVVCSNSSNGGDVGVCQTPGPTTAGGTCDPEGDVCHYTASNYACGVSSARADCCGPQTPKFLACVLDPSGVPRCNAYTGVPGDAGVGCLASGDSCATATDCCNGHPCVPGAGGKLTCSATSCQGSGLTCTTNADCCAGLPCVAPPGSIQGTCTAVLPPPPPPGDGGTGGDASAGDGGSTDAGSVNDSGFASDGGFSCALYGQSCSALPCCAGTQCISGRCSTF